ncbi:NAD(P)/FAD-dependent oxidoreductase [Acidithiobacillus sp.]|jgi:dihydrolipoamide dehydrogenase|uniref:dihydrolipoyl dehydrogenase family protein n=1 Tax=Acidithiobacillus sp. TaxID=1872118 RepID=UPI0025BB8FBF|nr:NAD(P)/FAD-dependent oxidoreductase [Acidithiobacillus sp.]MCK9188386.1 NAD(P)/FAD-dependent oxidoreductase [Acidithiobacillus sp.]MCK9358807.1 NAD(P)/FAD-dependent oxidoreductase [Acidithiobacillus sp.]
MGTSNYDITIIGSGPGGYRAAVLAALRGKKAAIIEKQTWGGTCLNRGCVPKKDWHETAKWIEQSRHFKKRGVVGPALTGDMAQAWQHQHQVVETVRTSYVDYLKRLGVHLYDGAGHFLDPQRLQIQGVEGLTEIHTETSIIATGSAPALPTGIAAVPGKVLTSDMLYDDGVPSGDRVILVGGGVIGTEFAYIFTQLGKQVEWLVHSPSLAHTQYSPQAKEALKAALAALNIHPQAGFKISRIETAIDGVTVFNDQGESAQSDWLLLATGRHAFTEGLGLENTGVTLDDRGFVQTNTLLETKEPGIYAIGDAVGPIMNANQALSDAQIVIHNLLSEEKRERDPLWVPELVYSAVELARIGMDDDAAEDQGFEPAVGFAAFETSPRALGQDDSAGFVRLLADMDSGELLGGEIVGRDAGELIHLLSSSGNRDEALRRIVETRVNHPSRAEELVNATETLAARWGLEEQIFGATD